jgi:GcrA cell cycle regulator
MQNAQTQSQIARVSSTENSPAGDHVTPAASGAPGQVCKIPLTDAELRRALAACASSQWPFERLLVLCREWIAGASTVEIGAKVHATKNAAVGKIHRLIDFGILDPRPSPIIRDGNDRAHSSNPNHRAPPAGRYTLPPLASSPAQAEIESPADPAPPRAARSVVVTPDPSLRGPPRAPVVVWVTAEYDSGQVIVTPPAAPPKPRPPHQAPATRPPLAPPPPRYGRIVDCCWPIGEPGTRPFHFCDAPSEPGRPYCQDHVKRAYTKERGHAAPLAGSRAELSGAAS